VAGPYNRDPKEFSVTEKELELRREQARAIALQVVLDWQTNQLNFLLALLPTAAQPPTVTAMQEKLSELADHFAMLPFRHLDPAEADLMSAEFHAQLVPLLEALKQELGQPPRW
jgi:hypothetical protein